MSQLNDAQAQPVALQRTLGLKSVVLFGVSYMAPLIVLGTFGVIAEVSNGTVPSSYLAATIAMLFTAMSYGRMASVYPVAGSAYTYVRKAVHPNAGLLVGWAALLDYFFLPMVIWLIGASFLQAQFPHVPISVWILGFIALTTVLNVLGITVAEKASFLLMAFQVLVIVIFVVLCVVHLSRHGGSLVSGAPFWHAGASVAGVSAGAAIAAYSFLGFDAVTTLAEETKEPARTVPRAIILVALIGGAIFIAISYVAQVTHPGAIFDDPESAAFEIAKQIGGNLFSAVFIAGLVVTQFGSGIAAQSSAARLTYAMGRDGVLPPRFFGYLSPRFRTPLFNILLSAAVGLLALELDVTTSTSFINFGAFVAFTMVNVSVVAHFLRQRRKDGPRSSRLGMARDLLFPLVGAVISIYLLTQLDNNALELGVAWLAVGIVWLLVLTRGLRRPAPELHVEDFEHLTPNDRGGATEHPFTI